MVDTTVKTLAENIKLPVDSLITKMKEAGLPHSSADDVVTEEQQKVLLAHMQGGSAEPKKDYFATQENEYFTYYSRFWKI